MVAHTVRTGYARNMETETLTTEYHDGALYGIRHPGPADGCPYCRDTVRQSETFNPHRYVVETGQGFTESFDLQTITTLERLGLIRHVRDGHVIVDSNGNGSGPLHRFYGPA